MRQIGTIADEAKARVLADHLLTLGIATKLDRYQGESIVWVQNEDRVDQARQELGDFLANPDDPKYRQAAGDAKTIRKKAEGVRREHERQSVYLRDRWLHRSPSRIPVTIGMIAACTGIFLVSWMINPRIRNYLFITVSVDDFQWQPELWREHLTSLVEIARGQVWRLVTPIFMHGSLLHIVFNMYWLAEFGGQIELLRGSRRFALLVIALAIASNLAQYLVAGPWFLGMSGVIYGLFGYIWMRTRYEPDTPFRLRSSTVPVMMIWLLFCMTGAFGQVGMDIANAAHIGGLVAGMVIGVAPFLPNALRSN